MPTRPHLHGIAVSPGLAIGPVHVIGARHDSVPHWSVREDEVAGEIARLAAAVRWVSDDLVRRQQVLRNEGNKDIEILGMQRTILQDPRALGEVEGGIRDQRINAESAVKMVVDRLAQTMSRLDGEHSRSFASDFSDPWLRVLDALLERDHQAISSTAERVVLAASDLTPQVVTWLERERILAVVAESGGRFSHGAVLARSLGIPCVIALPNLLARLEQGMQVTVDGGEGRVQLRPGPEETAEFDRRKVAWEKRRTALTEEAGGTAVTTDGRRMDVCANIESVRDLDTFGPEACDGVGLFRTEFLYLERPQFPSEEEQYRLYRRVLERMHPLPVRMRTLDIGGDKQLAYFRTPRENNPALGWRGLRISLEWRDLLRVQLRAMLRASAYGRLEILLPMVSSLEEVQEVHGVFDSVKRELVQQGYEVAADVPVGIMVEVPSALLALHHFLPEVDFVSVGTNDLVQYLLAVDRDNAWVSRLYDPQHPAVMLALERVATLSRAAGKPCAVCGEIAGDPAVAVLLLGLGYDSVSVAPHFLPEIKYAVRRISAAEAESLAREALDQTASEGVRKVLSRARARLYDQPAG